MNITSLTIKTAAALLLLSGAVYAIAGPEVALRYLQRMDPNVPNPVTLERQSAPYCADPAYPNMRNGRCYQ